MVMSGWRIYDASPIFEGFAFWRVFTLGAGLANALQWHFAAMWLLFGNGLFYLAYNFYTGRFGRKFLPLSPRELLGDVFNTLRLKLAHEDLSHYNAIQKLAYLGVMAALVIVIMSGLVVWKSAQFPTLRMLMGDYDNARIIHFAAMSAIVLFSAVHVLMVLVVPQTLKTMTGLGAKGVE
jgi:thiosulfate reductase cytochrome b subunit